jgi:Tol biopolymer transport system component
VLSLATGAERSFTLQGAVNDVAFSPNDEQLAFTVGIRHVRVATIDIGQGLASVRDVGPTHRNVRAPAWSEDGKTIFYTASDDEPYQPDEPCCPDYSELDLLRVSDVYALDATTGEERQITHAAIGERYYTVHAYGHRLLTTHAVSQRDSTGAVVIGAGDEVIGWLSQDGDDFEPMLDADGHQVTGMTAELRGD